MWPGCDVTFHGRNVTYWKPYQHNTSLSKSVDLAVEWLTHDMVPANLIFLYHDQPDMAGHVYGPDSPYYSDVLKQVSCLTWRSTDMRNFIDLVVSDFKTIHLT